MNDKNFFLLQHSLLKFIWVFLVIFLVFVGKRYNLALLLCLNLIYFLPQKSIIFTFFKTVLRLSFFWISYLIMGLLFDLSFTKQISFILTFLCSLQVSVFCLMAFNLDNLNHDFKLQDSNHVKNHIKIIIGKLFVFITLVSYFLLIFKARYTEIVKSVPARKRFSITYIENILIGIKELLNDVFNEDIRINTISKEVTTDDYSIRYNQSTTYSFFNKYNLYGYYFITLNIILISM